MKYKMIDKFFDNLLIFMLIMSTGGMLFVLNRNVASASFLIILLVVVSFFGRSFKKSLVSSSVLVVLLILLLGGVNYYYAISEQTTNKYMFYFLNFIISILFIVHFLNNRNKEIFIKQLYFVLKLIAIHALINFIAFFFIKNNLSSVNSAYNEFQTFQNIFFYMVDRNYNLNFFGLEFCRNQGLFWEPGVLQVFLNMLFFIEAFIIKKNRFFLILIAFIILTTYSTTGLFLLLLQTAVFLKNEFRRNKLILPVIVILFLPVYLIFNTNINNKFKGEEVMSFQKRLFDLTQPAFIAIEHPLTGIGLDLFQFQKIRQEFYLSSEYVEQINSLFGVEIQVDVTDRGSTNSIMFLLATTGFPTAILLLFMFFKQQIIQHKKWLWMIIMVISVMSEPLLLRPFFIVFIISGFIHTFYKITSHKRQLLT